jgi:hypothetical protein
MAVDYSDGLWMLAAKDNSDKIGEKVGSGGWWRKRDAEDGGGGKTEDGQRIAAEERRT